jgi:tRNA nucleotidyltransferase (CCA-adding enzyme)
MGADALSQPHVGHVDLNSFAEQRVNLPKDLAQKHRDHVNRLRERLQKHVEDNPSFSLVKMLHAGSVAKGTALRNVNDLDVAVYVKREDAPEKDLVSWLAERLREANPNMNPDQFTVNEHCVTIEFRGAGLDVDVVPVLYEGAKDDVGFLIDKHGNRMKTSIPRHLDFIRSRKEKNPQYAQVVRLVKWWAAQQKKDASFKCKSFMIELILAHLSDKGIDISDFPQAMQAFFDYIVTSRLKKRISFSDYYPASSLPGPTGNPIEIFDPVNPLNNVTCLYSASDRDRLVAAAESAADAISEARYSDTKGRAVECWQLVLGPSFRG